MSDWTLELLDELAGSSRLKLDRGVRARHFAASDWGGLVFGKPVAVARPHDSSEVAAALRFASERGLQITVRATGASSGGQAVADRTLVLDMTGMDDVGVDVAARTVTCGPGATWRSVLFATLPHGLQPYVMPLQLDLTVGGTLSVGGFGAVGHRFGVAGSHARSLEVVTGDGRRLTCDAHSEAALFDAVRGGLGRCGVITRATLNLRSAPPSVGVVRVRSSSVESWTADLLKLSEIYGEDDAANVVHIEGFCRTEPGGLECELHLGIEDGPRPPTAPIADAAAELLLRADWTPYAYASRLDPRFEEMVAGGYTDRGHPWIEALLSPDAFVDLRQSIMSGIAGDAGDRIQVVLVRGDALPPMVVAPAGKVLIGVVIVPRGIPREQLPRATDAMARVNELILSAGGKRYLAGWLPDTGEDAWRRHFGGRFDDWQQARATYDPAGVFTSALFARLDGRG